MIINAEKFTPEFVPPPPRYIITLNLNETEYEFFRAIVGSDYTVSKALYLDTGGKNYNDLRTMLQQMYDTICNLDKAK